MMLIVMGTHVIFEVYHHYGMGLLKGYLLRVVQFIPTL